MESRYYEASMPGLYGGVRALARYSGSPVSVAGRWLEKQDPYTLHKPTAKRFLRRKTFAKTINDVFQANLADIRNLASFNDGYSYIRASTFFPLRVCRASQRQTRTRRIGGIREAI
jgi:hypothetical protein